MADGPEFCRGLQQHWCQRVHPLHGHTGAWPGNADDGKRILPPKHGGRHGGHALGEHLVDHGVAAHAGRMQEDQIVRS